VPLRATLIAVFAVLSLSAQQPAGGPEFEVASVKPVEAPPGPHAVALRIEHGTARIDAATLRQIIVQAYLVQRVNVLGGPAWYDSDLYDVIAKAASPDATPEQIRQMLQALLADRFKLAVHRETRDLTRYALVVGKNGAKLQAAKADESTGLQQGQNGQLVFQRHPMITLVNTIANLIDAPVDDKTGLTGRFDFQLDFTPEPGRDPLDRMDLALQALDRIGLKLEAKKVPTEVLLVDHADRPSPN
jgi:uncharacterized protein (TIGR03435 family)